MVRIGILGADNSHALHFSRLINKKDEKTGEYLFPDFKVTHIFGIEKEITKQRAEGGDIKNIVDCPDKMFGNVDAVIVDFRHGDIHRKYALPFIEAGIPTFIDKPFTNKIEDTKILVDAARKHGTLLTGGSTLKYLDGVVDLKKYLDEKGIYNTGTDNFVTAMLSFQVSLHPEYGGIHFYGQHTVEPALFLFGYDVKSVYASRTDKNIIAVLTYDRYQVVLNFMYQGEGLHVNIMEKNGQISRKIDDSDDYKKGMENFINVLERKESDLSYEQILIPVVVLNAVEQSIVENRKIYIKDLISTVI